MDQGSLLGGLIDQGLTNGPIDLEILGKNKGAFINYGLGGGSAN